MPRTAARRVAQIRAEITEERVSEAAAGVFRDDHGLDHCDEAQRHLRCLLALGTFNTESLGNAGDWRISGITSYTLVLSPRPSALKIVTNAPHNVAERLLLGHGNPAIGVPGLRLEAADWQTCVLRHVVTGAELLITQRRGPLSRPPAGTYCRRYRDDRVQLSLSDAERSALQSLPQLSVDASVLLSALFVRLNVTDPGGKWATGLWWWDPLDRGQVSVQGYRRRLSGAGDRWELRWTGHPRTTDVVAALTDHRIAVDGIHVTRLAEDLYVAGRGAARLLFGRLLVAPKERPDLGGAGHV